MNNLLKLEKKAYLSFKPPKKLSLSQWADKNAYLSAEISAFFASIFLSFSIIKS